MRHRTRLFAGVFAVLMILGISAAHGWIRQVYAQGGECLTIIGFACQQSSVADEDVRPLLEDALEQILGPEGLAAIMGPGSHVVIKPNLVGPKDGPTGQAGLAVITDARVVRVLAEMVREVIGDENGADLKVADACFRTGGPSDATTNWHGGFRYARIERTGDDAKNAGDYCYDYDNDGILDGASNAQLVNTDDLGKSDRYLTIVNEPTLGAVEVWLPKFLRTKEDAVAAGEPDNYCDVLINVPTFKIHRGEGTTGAIKNYYGLRTQYGFSGDAGRGSHSGTSYQSDSWGNMTNTNGHLFDEYIVAMHRARKEDLIVTDCITLNRRGPSEIIGTDNEVDFIYTNAIMAGTDPVAMDTALSLLAGGDPATVALIRRGALDGLGTDDPGRIRIASMNAMGEHRSWLLGQYNPHRQPTAVSDPYSLYPMVDGWGQMRLKEDYNAPLSVAAGVPVCLGNGRYGLRFSADEILPGDTGLARVEVLVEGEVAGYALGAGLTDGCVDVDVTPLTGKSGTLTYQIAAWDETLNVAVSGEYILDLSLRPEAEMVFGGVFGMPVELSVQCDAPDAEYQWYCDGVLIEGATGAAFYLESLSPEDVGAYSCVVTLDGASVETAGIEVDGAGELPLSGAAAAILALLAGGAAWRRLRTGG